MSVVKRSCARCGHDGLQHAGPGLGCAVAHCLCAEYIAGTSCRCDEPTCRLCHPIMSRIIAGNLTGGENAFIIDPGVLVPDHNQEPEPFDAVGFGTALAIGFGTALAIIGGIIGLLTIAVMIGDEWGWYWSAVWVAAAFITIGAALSATHKDD